MLSYDPDKKIWRAWWFISSEATVHELSGRFENGNLVMISKPVQMPGATEDFVHRATWQKTSDKLLHFTLEFKQDDSWSRLSIATTRKSNRPVARKHKRGKKGDMVNWKIRMSPFVARRMLASSNVHSLLRQQQDFADIFPILNEVMSLGGLFQGELGGDDRIDNAPLKPIQQNVQPAPHARHLVP